MLLLDSQGLPITDFAGVQLTIPDVNIIQSLNFTLNNSPQTTLANVNLLIISASVISLNITITS